MCEEMRVGMGEVSEVMAEYAYLFEAKFEREYNY